MIRFRFLKKTKVKIIPGSEAAPIVNPFYERHSGKALARDTDLFFVAFSGREVVGAVRFCLESETPILRSMMIHEEHRRTGIGRQLLSEFESYLIEYSIRNTFCLAYGHLEEFYGKIGFHVFPEEQAPKFLQERLSEYRKKPEKFLCMCRP